MNSLLSLKGRPWSLPFVLSLCIICLGLILTSNHAHAAIIDLSISTSQVNNEIHVTVLNRSFDPVKLEGLELLVFERHYKAAGILLPARMSHTHTFKIEMPSISGSYPIIATLYYTNEGQPLSLVHVGTLINDRPGPEPPESGRLYGLSMVQNGTLVLKASNSEIWRLILPSEVQVVQKTHGNGLSMYFLHTKTRGLDNSYAIFAVAEGHGETGHWTKILQTRLHVLSDQDKRGITPNSLLMAMALLALMAWCSVNTRLKNISFSHADETRTQVFNALLKYASRILLLSLAYLLLKNAHIIVSWCSDGLVRLLQVSWPLLPAQLLIEHFIGKNYGYFFQYFVDVYYWLSVLLLFPYLYYTDRHILAFDDKYVNTIRTFLTSYRLLLFKRPHINELSRLGLLTVCVKLFFAPMLVSWAINNILHINNLIHTQTLWNLKTTNSFIVDCLILLDTTIFSIGYTIESSYLKNVIKSVEPTLLGWVVCLWCYPPFNAFSFSPFNIQLWNISIQNRPDWLDGLILCVITGLWAVFVWGSVALGFKGSNLTNRGIISHGPYRFCRHPAYTAKVLVWWLEGIFFAKYGLSMLIAFAVIYGLRAWTEERHLMRDPDYAAYRKQVKWWCIPHIL